MNYVEPIKSKWKLKLIKDQLKRYYADIYLDIFIFGLNTGLRISDIVKLKFSDINLHEDYLELTEKKTNKTINIILNSESKKVIHRRGENYPDDDFIFAVHTNRSTGSPITRQSVSRVFKEVGDSREIGLKISTHSLRKTRAYHLFENGYDINVIAKMLNHSSAGEVIRYIGLNYTDIDGQQKKLDKSYNDMIL